MRIAVFSGSFDPLHIGHLAIMEHLTRVHDFDWVYLVISPQNPMKAPNKIESAQSRYEAAVEAVKRHPELHVWVDDIEFKMPAPHYTVKTLDALKRREPENEFTLVMGADSLAYIHDWRDFPRILSEYGVAVYPRKGYDLEQIRATLQQECRQHPAPYVLDPYSTFKTADTLGFEDFNESMYNIKILDAPIVDISSTEIRLNEAQGIDMSKYRM